MALFCPMFPKHKFKSEYDSFASVRQEQQRSYLSRSLGALDGTREDGKWANGETVDSLTPCTPARVIHSFEATVDDELSVQQGDRLSALYKDDNWLYCVHQTRGHGFIPALYCQLNVSPMSNVSPNTMHTKSITHKSSDDDHIDRKKPNITDSSNVHESDWTDTEVETSERKKRIGAKMEKKRTGSLRTQFAVSFLRPRSKSLGPDKDSLPHVDQQADKAVANVKHFLDTLHVKPYNECAVDVHVRDSGHVTSISPIHVRDNGHVTSESKPPLHVRENRHVTSSDPSPLHVRENGHPHSQRSFRVSDNDSSHKCALPTRTENADHSADGISTRNEMQSGNLTDISASFQTHNEENEAGSMEFRKKPIGRYIAAFRFDGRFSDDLTIRPGSILTALNKEDADWTYVIDSTGRQGFVPANYILPIHADDEWRGSGDRGQEAEMDVDGTRQHELLVTGDTRPQSVHDLAVFTGDWVYCRHPLHSSVHWLWVYCPRIRASGFVPTHLLTKPMATVL